MWIEGTHSVMIDASSCRTRTATEVTQPGPVHWVGEQRLVCREKLLRVRECRVKFKRGLIRPLRMDGEHTRLPQRLEYIDAHTAQLGT